MAILYLGLPKKLLKLMLRQQAMVYDKGRDFWRPLCFIIDCSMNVHVAVQYGKKLVFPLQYKRGQIQTEIMVFNGWKTKFN